MKEGIEIKEGIFDLTIAEIDEIMATDPDGLGLIIEKSMNRYIVMKKLIKKLNDMVEVIGEINYKGNINTIELETLFVAISKTLDPEAEYDVSIVIKKK